MKSASQLLHAALGSPAHKLCKDVSDLCWVCAGTMTRGLLRTEWMGANFTGQNRVKHWAGTYVCEACLCVTEWATPMTMPVPGAAEIAAANAEKKAAARAAKIAAGGKVGKERDLGWRLFSVLFDDGIVTTVNKASKPRIVQWLRTPKRGVWFAAIADTGQKHIVPWAPVNAAGIRGAVLFEEQTVQLPGESGWRLVDDMSSLLTAGATKEEIGRGEYGMHAYQRCTEQIDAFEASWSHHRASAFWELALWLAQRDEAKVTARIEAEKEAKKNGARGKAKESAGGPDGKRRARDPKRVPSEPGVQRPQALGSDPGQDATGGEDLTDLRRMDNVSAPSAPAERTKQGQLTLF